MDTRDPTAIDPATLLRALERLAIGGSPAETSPEAPALPSAVAEALAEVADRIARLEARAARADHLEETIERLPIGFFRNSLRDGTILYCNEENARLLGYASMADAQANMGRSTTAYVHPEERDEMKAALARDGKVDAFRVAVYRKDGSIGHVEFSARLYPADGYLEGVMIDYSHQHAREQALAATSDALRQRTELLEAQRETILRLSVPVAEIWEGVLGVPLIGHLGGERTRQLMDTILTHVVRKQARAVVLDMTGVDAVGEVTAENLMRLARAIKLLGSRVVLCGVRSDVARVLVTLGVELDAFEIDASLKDAIARFIAEARTRGSGAGRRAR